MRRVPCRCHVSPPWLRPSIKTRGAEKRDGRGSEKKAQNKKKMQRWPAADNLDPVHASLAIARAGLGYLYNASDQFVPISALARFHRCIGGDPLCVGAVF